MARHGASGCGSKVRGAVLGLLALGCGECLMGCDDRLPGFADPPPYDAGDQADAEAGGDEDAG